jgi:hypothetical protein
MATPLDAIVRQGRARRRRHWFTGLAGTAAVAVAALVIGLAGSSARRQHTARPPSGLRRLRWSATPTARPR